MQEDDRFHRALQSFLTLLDGIDEPLGGIEFLFHKLDSFLHLGCLVRFVTGIILKHLRIFTVDAHIGDSPVVHAQDQFTTCRLHYKIGNDLAQSCFHRTSPTGTRFRIEGCYLTNGLFQGGLVDIQSSYDLVVMFTGKLFEKIS